MAILKTQPILQVLYNSENTNITLVQCRQIQSLAVLHRAPTANETLCKQNWSSIPKKGMRFRFLHRAQTASGAHSASYPIGAGDSFPENKASAV
jgi:hypothetical protein